MYVFTTIVKLIKFVAKIKEQFHYLNVLWHYFIALEYIFMISGYFYNIKKIKWQMFYNCRKLYCFISWNIPSIKQLAIRNYLIWYYYFITNSKNLRQFSKCPAKSHERPSTPLPKIAKPQKKSDMLTKF